LISFRIFLIIVLCSKPNPSKSEPTFHCHYEAYGNTDPKPLFCKIFDITLFSRPASCRKSGNSSIPCIPEQELSFSGTDQQKNDTKILFFSSCNVKFVPSIIFKVFPSLQELRIWNANETTVENGTFWMMNPLKGLNLGNYQNISDGSLDGLGELEFLDLSDNFFQQLPKDIFRDNKKLKSLILHSNKLEEIDENLLENLEDLEEIDLSENPIKEFPTKLFQHNSKLRKVRLIQVGLKTVEKALLENLGGLEAIDLSRNHLSQLPADLFSANKKLKQIFIHSNQIEELAPKLLENQGSLEYFHAGSNKLRTLPKEIFQETRDLKTVDVRFNPLEAWDDEVIQNLTSVAVYRDEAGILKVSWIILTFNVVLINFFL
jgi:Leucine-rich repeat (LRR) protein